MGWGFRVCVIAFHLEAAHRTVFSGFEFGENESILYSCVVFCIRVSGANQLVTLAQVRLIVNIPDGNDAARSIDGAIGLEIDSVAIAVVVVFGEYTVYVEVYGSVWSHP